MRVYDSVMMTNTNDNSISIFIEADNYVRKGPQ